MEQPLWGHFSGCKEEKVADNSHQGFPEGNSCLVAFLATPGFVDEVETRDVVYLNFSRVFDVMSHVISCPK